jgi:hypothetical protein
MNKHGELLLSWEESILIVRANGSFNEEGALAAVTEVKKSVLAKKHPCWQRLGFWDEEYLGSPETMQLFKEVHEWCLSNGCVKVAVVVCNSLQQQVAEKIFSSKAKVFRCEHDARAWLISEVTPAHIVSNMN